MTLAHFYIDLLYMYFGNMLVQAVCKKLQIHERTYRKEYLVLSKPHFISARINKGFFGSIFVNSYCSITKNIEKSKERKRKNQLTATDLIELCGGTAGKSQPLNFSSHAIRLSLLERFLNWNSVSRLKAYTQTTKNKLITNISLRP